MNEFPPKSSRHTYEPPNLDLPPREVDDPASIEIKTPLLGVRYRGKMPNLDEVKSAATSSITLQVLTLFAVLAVVGIEGLHATSTKSDMTAVAELKTAVESNTNAMLLMTCVNAQPKDRQELEITNEFSTCRMNNPLTKRR